MAQPSAWGTRYDCKKPTLSPLPFRQRCHPSAGRFKGRRGAALSQAAGGCHREDECDRREFSGSRLPPTSENRVRPNIAQVPGYESRRPAASSSMADRSIASAEITPSRQRVCARNVA